MRQAYEHTWQFYIRLNHFSTRRADFLPYLVLKKVDEFLVERQERKILDWGCGENNLKLAYPDCDIHGIDQTHEADTYGYPFECFDDFECDDIIAVNSIHFTDEKNLVSDVERIVNEKLQENGSIFFTINNTGNFKAEKFADQEIWRRLGKLHYYWFMGDHEKAVMEDIENYLTNDQICNYRNRQGILSIKEVIMDTINQTVRQDPFFGLLRIHLKK